MLGNSTRWSASICRSWCWRVRLLHWCTFPTRLGIDRTRFSHTFESILLNCSSSLVFKSSTVLISRPLSFWSRRNQICSMGFKSGELAGQSMTRIWSSSITFLVFMDVCGRALSCWNIHSWLLANQMALDDIDIPSWVDGAVIELAASSALEYHTALYNNQAIPPTILTVTSSSSGSIPTRNKTRCPFFRWNGLKFDSSEKMTFFQSSTVQSRCAKHHYRRLCLCFLVSSCRLTIDLILSSGILFWRVVRLISTLDLRISE